MQMSNARAHQNMPPPGPTKPWDPSPSSFPMSVGGPGFGANPQYMPPPRQFDNYFPRVDMPLDMQPHLAPCLRQRCFSGISCKCATTTIHCFKGHTKHPNSFVIW